MSATSITTIIFDLDGTLVDTAPDLIAVADEMLAELQAGPLDAGQGRLAAGQGARALLTLGLQAAGRPLPGEDAWPALIEDFIARYQARMTALSRPFEGVPELLQRLADAGLTMSVCTNKRTELAEELLRALDLRAHFAAIVGGDSLPEKKPHPAPVEHAASLASAKPHQALMLGDSHADITAAKAAGSLPVLAAWGYVREPLAGYGAASICHHPAELESLLRHFIAGT